MAVCVLNSSFNVELLNSSFNELFGDIDNFNKLQAYLSNNDFVSLKKIIDQVLSDGSSVEIDLNIHLKKSNTLLFTCYVYSFKTTAERKITLEFRDVSERRQNQELEAYRDALDKMNVELDQFVYKTAHYLRAPLTNLIGLIGLMRNEQDLDVLNTYFDLQETSVKKMDEFIQKITTYTKNTRLPLTISRIDFKVLINNILDDLIYYDKSENVRKNISIDVAGDFYSNYDRLEIVLRNLLANSIKFSHQKPNSELSLKVIKTSEGCKIILIDNGIGIPDSIQHKVFDMFYRGHASADGSGIGLYIVQETVAKLGGKIELDSKENEFTKITLNLPSISV